MPASWRSRLRSDGAGLAAPGPIPRTAEAGTVVEVGVGAEEAARAHAGHIRRVRDGRPHVLLKLAVSADGKAGLAGRRPAVITGEPARARVHAMRAMSD